MLQSQRWSRRGLRSCGSSAEAWASLTLGLLLLVGSVARSSVPAAPALSLALANGGLGAPPRPLQTLPERCRRPLLLSGVVAAGCLQISPAKVQALEGRVVRPPEGKPLYSFELPPGNTFYREIVDDDPENPGRIAKFTDLIGATILSGPTPEKEFMKKQRAGSIPSRRKILKYQLGEQQDDFECLVKIIQDNGRIDVVHRWFRVLRDATEERSALLILEVPQDKFEEEGRMMEAILASFRLGA